MSNFAVGQKLKEYMACRNGLMIFMGGETVLAEINNGTVLRYLSIALSLLILRMFLLETKTGPCLQVVSIEDEGQAWKWDTFSNITFRNIHLHDLRGRQLNVVLYGDLGLNFVAEQVFKQDRQVPIVAVFAGMLVQWYKGRGFTVRLTSASKYYLDLDIPEVQKFRASLAGSHKPINRLPCQVQNPINPSVLVNSWRTIKQLTSLDPYELQQGTSFLCRATLKGCTKGWSYLSCFHCRQSINWDGSKPLCIKGCPNNMSPVARYKLDATIEDETGAMNVMIFDDPAQELVDVPAKDLVEEGTGDDISAVVSSQQRHAFEVAFGNGCFVVKRILKDDDLQLLINGSVQMEAGQSSQDEGSSASNSSSSQVTQEDMVIKEEMEAGGELSQDEGSSAPNISNLQVKQEEMVIKEEVEAGGVGDGSQHEGSSASYISSSQVKQEDMVIKEEMEAGVGGALAQHECSSASYNSSPAKKLKR